jgi:hypothetical protein
MNRYHVLVSSFFQTILLYIQKREIERKTREKIDRKKRSSSIH